MRCPAVALAVCALEVALGCLGPRLGLPAGQLAFAVPAAQRHKICRTCFNLPEVKLGGSRLRFCQQVKDAHPAPLGLGSQGVGGQ
jgi:hypothetical protein